MRVLLPKEWARIQALPWTEFFLALPGYLDLKRSVKRERVGNVTLCSLYDPIKIDFDIWLE